MEGALCVNVFCHDFKIEEFALPGFLVKRHFFFFKGGGWGGGSVVSCVRTIVYSCCTISDNRYLCHSFIDVP